MFNMRWARWISVAATGMGVVLAVVGASRMVTDVSAQSDSALIKVVAPAGEIKKGTRAIPIDITVDGAKNMASFQFDLKFNGNIFEADDRRDGTAPDAACTRAGRKPPCFVDKGDFLGSTGREVVCNPVSDAGVVRVSCVTLGPTPPGANGSGKLMTVYLSAIGSGSTELVLDRVLANTVSETAEVMPTSTQGATLAVAGGGGFNYLLWIPIIAVVVLVVAGGGAFGAMRMRSGTNKPAAVA